ncbi:MAG: CBS domain-containing protein [Halobacteriales archaeon]
MAIVGVFGNPILVVIALFVYMAAASESRATVVRELLRGVVVRDMMRRDVPTVAADATVEGLFDRIMAERTPRFPVIDGGPAVGIVTIEEVRDVDPADRATTLVRDVMRTDLATVGPDEDAFRALQAHSEHGGPLIVAADRGFLGVVAEADFVRTIEAIQGLGEADRPELAPEGYA